MNSAGPQRNTCVWASASTSNSRYQAAARSARSPSATLPHTTINVSRVPACVFVRCESLTALAHGPSASKRQTNPPTSISCPEALKIYFVPTGAMPIRSGFWARSRSMILIGNPLCNDTTLQASTPMLMAPSAPSPTARSKYSDEGLPRPVGL